MHHPLISRRLRFLVVAGAIAFLGASCQQVTDGGVFKSEDGGETWQQKTFMGVQKKRVVGIHDVNVLGLLMDPTNADVLYLGSRDAGIYKTETAGEQWRKLNLAVGRVPDVAIAPDNANILYIAHQHTILKSFDGGEQWQVMYADPQGGIINDIEIDWSAPQHLFAATSTGLILESKDYGVTWSVLFETAEPLTQLTLSQQNAGRLYALELERNIYISNNGGESFQPLLTPELQKEVAAAFQIHGIAPKQFAVDPSNDSMLYIADANGLFRSQDSGARWELIQTLLEKGAPQNAQIQNITIPYNTPNMILFTIGNQIHKTEDGGLTWKTITTFPSTQRITTIVPHPTMPAILFAGVEQVEKPRRGIIGQ